MATKKKSAAGRKTASGKKTDDMGRSFEKIADYIEKNYWSRLRHDQGE